MHVFFNMPELVVLIYHSRHRSEPLSNVPIDLLFLHLVLPQTMHHFRPKRAVRNWATRIWKFFARWFRLTSYFFGGRHPEEEIPSRQWWFGQTSVAGDAFEGSFRRVPATDYIALGRDVRATARVNEDGSPFDEEAASLIEQQNREAEKAQHDPSKDYMIVYLPPYFRYRLFAFMLSMWTTCAIMFGFAVAFPIQLGRSVFSVFTPREVHDGYSLLLGFYLLWACYLFGKAIDRLDKRRQRVRVDDGPNADLRLLVLKRGLLWTAKTLYMSLSLGVVVPILLALVMDLYVVLPIRKALAPGAVPRVRLVDAWALGLVYGKIALHVTQLHPPNEVTRGLHNVSYRYCCCRLRRVDRVVHITDRLEWLGTARPCKGDQRSHCTVDWWTAGDDRIPRSIATACTLCYPIAQGSLRFHT